MIICVVGMSTWCVFPFLLKHWSYDPDDELANNATGRLHFEYFVIATWIPENALTFPVYYIIYACQFFYIWSVVSTSTVGNMVFSSIFYGITTHFQLLSAAIRDIDDIYVDFNADLVKQEYVTLSGTTLHSNIVETKLYNTETLREPKQTHLSTDNFSLTPINNVVARDMPCRDAMESADLPAPCANTRNCAEIAYMIQCIRYHQRLLQ